MVADNRNQDAIESRFGHFERITQGDTTAAALLTLASLLSGEQRPAAESGSLTVKQAAQLLNIGQTTIRALIESGRLPVQRFGNGRGTIRIRPDDLHAFRQSTVSAGMCGTTLDDVRRAGQPKAARQPRRAS